MGGLCRAFLKNHVGETDTLITDQPSQKSASIEILKFLMRHCHNRSVISIKKNLTRPTPHKTTKRRGFSSAVGSASSSLKTHQSIKGGAMGGNSRSCQNSQARSRC